MTCNRFIDYGIDPIRIGFSELRADKLHDFFLSQADEFFELYTTFRDDMSRESLRHYLLGNISGRYSFFRSVYTNRVIQADFVPQSGDIVIDAGAYDGGTASLFADMGCKVYSFEVDPEKFAIASKLAKQKNFIVENVGLADFDRSGTYFHQESVKSMGYVNLIGENYIGLNKDNTKNTPVNVTSIDSYVREHQLPCVNFMNLSVVGSELAAIRGAANTIARFKPKIVLECYQDLKSLLPLFKTLREIRPDYEFACRICGVTPIEMKLDFSDDLMQYCTRFGLKPKFMDQNGLYLFAR